MSPSDAPKVTRARVLMTSAARGDEVGVIALQSLAELHRLLIRKAGLPVDQARDVVETLARGYEVQATDAGTFEAALDLASRHRLQIFDAIILAAAARAGCKLLYSEDLQHGFVWGGVQVVNPFSTDLSSG